MMKALMSNKVREITKTFEGQKALQKSLVDLCNSTDDKPSVKFTIGTNNYTMEYMMNNWSEYE